MPVNTPTIKNTTTIIWGTESQLSDPSGAIVESIAVTPKYPTGLGEIENGNGAGVIDVLLDDGFDAEVTCIYDSAKDWPDTGASVTLTLPKQHGAGTNAYTCYVLGDPKVNTTKKQAATIAFTLRYRPGITP